MRKVITAVASGRPGHTSGSMPRKLTFLHRAFHSKRLRNVLELVLVILHLASRPACSRSLQMVGRDREDGGEEGRQQEPAMGEVLKNPRGPPAVPTTAENLVGPGGGEPSLPTKGLYVPCSV